MFLEMLFESDASWWPSCICSCYMGMFVGGRDMVQILGKRDSALQLLLPQLSRVEGWAKSSHCGPQRAMCPVTYTRRRAIPAILEFIKLSAGILRSPGGGHGNPPQYSCLENPHGQKSLAGPQFNPWGRKESDTTGQLSMQKLKAFCHCWQLNMECNYQTDVEQSKWVTPMTNTVKLGKYREKLRFSGPWDITMKTYGFITNGNVYFHIWNYLIFGSLAPSLFHPFGR